MSVQYIHLSWNPWIFLSDKSVFNNNNFNSLNSSCTNNILINFNIFFLTFSTATSVESSASARFEIPRYTLGMMGPCPECPLDSSGQKGFCQLSKPSGQRWEHHLRSLHLAHCQRWRPWPAREHEGLESPQPFAWNAVMLTWKLENKYRHVFFNHLDITYLYTCKCIHKFVFLFSTLFLFRRYWSYFVK